MKKIEAIIRRTKFDDVKEALLAADIEWFSYYEVRGVGKMREARIYRGVAYDTSSIERMLLSIVVRDKNVEKTVQAVTKAAYTGEIGDGASSSFRSRIPYGSVRENVATLRFTMQNKRSEAGRFPPRLKRWLNDKKVRLWIHQ